MDLSLILRGYIPFVISLTFHEAAHALAARLGGDNTAYLGGQVTLNPVPHMRREPFGTIVLPLLLLISTGGRQVMGWASAPIDPLWAMRHPRRAAVVSFAGPLANLLLAVSRSRSSSTRCARASITAKEHGSRSSRSRRCSSS